MPVTPETLKRMSTGGITPIMCLREKAAMYLADCNSRVSRKAGISSGPSAIIDVRTGPATVAPMTYQPAF